MWQTPTHAWLDDWWLAAAEDPDTQHKIAAENKVLQHSNITVIIQYQVSTTSVCDRR